MEPSAQPINGVTASITPKIIPGRSASDRRGLRRAVPLPTAAANASVDMASAKTMVERKFMGCSSRATHGLPSTARLRTGRVYGLAMPFGRLRHGIKAKNVDAALSREVESRLLPKEEIGRASCRERVCKYVEITVVAVYLKKKK